MEDVRLNLWDLPTYRPPVRASVTVAGSCIAAEARRVLLAALVKPGPHQKKA